MSGVLIVSLGILIIGLIFIGIGGYRDEEGVAMFGGVVFVLSLFIGFLICGTQIPVDATKTKITNYEIVKTDYSVIVDTSKGMKRFTDIKYANLTKNNTKAMYVKERNSYNNTIKKYLEVEKISETE